MLRFPREYEVRDVLHGMLKEKSYGLDELIVQVLIYHWNAINQQLADNLIFFYRASRKSLSTIKVILEEFTHLYRLRSKHQYKFCGILQESQ